MGKSTINGDFPWSIVRLVYQRVKYVETSPQIQPWHLFCLHELLPSQAAAGDGEPLQRQRRDGGH